MTMKAAAAAPSRSSGTVVVAWGLLNIELSLYTSTEETRVPRKEYSAAGNPVGRQLVDKVTGEVVDYASVVKVVEVGPGVTVPLTDDEIQAVTGTADGTAPIVGLIDRADIGTLFMPEKLYQVRPKATKKGVSGTTKAFALLTQALERRGQAALVKVALRSSAAKYAALTGDGYLIILSFTDGVREALPMPEAVIGSMELDMADKLLDAIGEDTLLPDMTDQTSAKIGEYVAAKVAGAGIATAAAPVAAEPTLDLMESLMASVAVAKEKKAAS